MRNKGIIVGVLLFLGLVFPGNVFSVAACLPAECEGERRLDLPVNCERHPIYNYCETEWITGAAIDCDAECRYEQTSLIVYPDLYAYKCADDALPPFCNRELTTFGPGTCCTGEGGGGGGGGCGTTAPGNLSINRDYSQTQARARWNPGSGGRKQALGASSNAAAVLANCAGAYRPACVIYEPDLSSSLDHHEENKTTFTEAGTVYYFKVINVASGSCSKSTTRPWLSSCTLTPGSSTLEIDETKLLTMNIADSPSIRQVNFSSDNAAVSVNPSVDSGTLAPNETYQTTATAVAAGTATITATARLFNDEYGEWSDCAATATITVNGSGPAEQASKILATRSLRIQYNSPDEQNRKRDYF